MSGHPAIFSVDYSPGSTSTPVWLVLRLLYLLPLKMVSAFQTFGVFSLAAGCRFLQSVNTEARCCVTSLLVDLVERRHWSATG
jgi:hypothetical protein